MGYSAVQGAGLEARNKAAWSAAVDGHAVIALSNNIVLHLRSLAARVWPQPQLEPPDSVPHTMLPEGCPRHAASKLLTAREAAPPPFPSIPLCFELNRRGIPRSTKRNQGTLQNCIAVDVVSGWRRSGGPERHRALKLSHQ